MPSNWSIVDATFPTFKGDESPKQQINALLDYMKVLTEQLQYSLDNLGVNNWNAAELKNFSNDVVAALAEDVIKLAQLVNAQESKLTTLTTRVDNLDKLSKTVGDLQNNVNTLQTITSELQDKVSALEGYLEPVRLLGERVSGIEVNVEKAIVDIGKLREDVDLLLGGTNETE